MRIMLQIRLRTHNPSSKVESGISYIVVRRVLKRTQGGFAK
jgi:hypothetical protein